MVETESNDKGNRIETGCLRVLGRLGRAIENTGEATVDPYSVVYPQEPLWLLDLRLVAPLPGDIDFIRVVLRPTNCGPGCTRRSEHFDGMHWWRGNITFYT